MRARFPPQDLGELLVDLAAEEGWHLGTEDLSEQGMTETDARGTLASDGNQSSPLEFYQDPVSGHLLPPGESKRFTDRQQFQKSASRICEAIEAGRNRLLQARRRPNSTGPSPHTMNLAKLTCLQHIGNQFSGKEDVATGCFPHSLQGGALDDAVQRPLEHLVELGSRQCLQLQPRDVTVSAESVECIRDRGSAAKCQKDGREPPDGDVVDESGREAIEQVHVVHRQDDRPTLGAALQMLAEDTQQVDLIDFVQIAWGEAERTHRREAAAPIPKR